MDASRKVAFYTLGCKLNFSETSTLARKFSEQGYEKVDFEEAADVYVINTCSVTDNADKKCRYVVRKARTQSPDAKIVVVGCYAQLQPEQIAEIPEVDMVLGAAEKFRILEHLQEMNAEEAHGCYVQASGIDEVDFYVDAYSAGDRIRTFLKVQDGCDYGCAFCTIPLARGRSRSMDVASVVRNAEEIALNGTKEVVLTGVNIGDFGKGPSGARQSEESFFDLVKALDEVEGIERFRISSIEPNLLKDEIIEVVARSKRFMPHFHIPLQSGSNKLLKLMRRRYLRELYADRVTTIKRLMPHACIGVDVIVGFPGETEEDFLDTYNFLNELDVSYLHVFTYSERPNTAAIEMDGVVSIENRRKRSRMLRGLSAKKRRYFYEQHVGSSREVLYESENDGGFMYGFTDNYVRIKRPFEEALVNTIQEVELDKVDSAGEMRIKDFSENYTIVS